MMSATVASPGDFTEEKEGIIARINRFFKESWTSVTEKFQGSFLGTAWKKWISWGSGTVSPDWTEKDLEQRGHPRNLLGFLQDVTGGAIALPFVVAYRTIKLAWLLCTNPVGDYGFTFEASYLLGRIGIATIALLGANVVMQDVGEVTLGGKDITVRKPRIDWIPVGVFVYVFFFASIFATLFVEMGLGWLALAFMVVPLFVLFLRNFNTAKIRFREYTRKNHYARGRKLHLDAQTISHQSEEAAVDNLIVSRSDHERTMVGRDSVGRRQLAAIVGANQLTQDYDNSGPDPDGSTPGGDPLAIGSDSEEADEVQETVDSMVESIFEHRGSDVPVNLPVPKHGGADAILEYPNGDHLEQWDGIWFLHQDYGDHKRLNTDVWLSRDPYDKGDWEKGGHLHPKLRFRSSLLRDLEEAGVAVRLRSSLVYTLMELETAYDMKIYVPYASAGRLGWMFSPEVRRILDAGLVVSRMSVKDVAKFVNLFLASDDDVEDAEIIDA